MFNMSGIIMVSVGIILLHAKTYCSRADKLFVKRLSLQELHGVNHWGQLYISKNESKHIIILKRFSANNKC